MKTSPKPVARTRTALAFCAAVLAALSTPVARAQAQGAAPPTPAPLDTPVGVQVVATNSTQIGAPMSGKLTVFPFRDGDRFKAGDNLAEFACDQQRATLLHAGAEAVKRRHMLATQQKLRSLGTYSDLDYKVAGAEVQAADADYALASANTALCVVKAPYSGRVSGTSVRNFQVVQAGQPMLDILDDSTLELEMIVPSSWMTGMSPGMPFDVSVRETGKTYPAQILRFGGRVDPVSQTVKVYGKITGSAAGLLPGMSGEALKLHTHA